jgi:uncharacterized protein
MQWLIDQSLKNWFTLAEQFVAQELRHIQDQGKLYYWQRLEKSSTAEVDFLAVKRGEVIPVEVKSGVAGRLRSLHLFLEHRAQTSFCDSSLIFE